MEAFLRRLLRVYRFEQMRIPLGVVATDLARGTPVVFKERGEVFLPIRASCSYPGLFRPVRYEDRHLVDGAMTMEVPAAALREMGATHVISVSLPSQGDCLDPRNLFQVINRSFQILQARTEQDWRRHSTLVLEPDVRGMRWDCFGSAADLIASGERAALTAVPVIERWLRRAEVPRSLKPVPRAAA
jgi:NTE family protein